MELYCGEKRWRRNQRKEKKRGGSGSDHRKEKLQSLDFIWSEMEIIPGLEMGVTREINWEERRRFQSKDTS